jgi:hypothetical protein
MILRRLLSLLSIFLLGSGLLFGSLAHAAEVAGSPEPTAATAWLHPDGDADQVAADSDKAAPHHHNACHGHDIATDAAAFPTECSVILIERLQAQTGSRVKEDPALLPLRPPIA